MCVTRDHYQIRLTHRTRFGLAIPFPHPLILITAQPNKCPNIYMTSTTTTWCVKNETLTAAIGPYTLFSAIGPFMEGTRK